MGSCFNSGVKVGGGGIGTRGRGGLAGALPLALELGFNSRINWLPALIAGFGGTGGLKKPPELIWLLARFRA